MNKKSMVEKAVDAVRGFAPIKLDLNPEFKRAFHLMSETNQSLFITGKAGTGKSTLLDYYCAHAIKSPVILAPTGVAALNVKGQTIHRFFNFYVDVTVEKIKQKKNKPRDPKIYKKLQTIIIDEASMLRADLLDCIDEFLRIYGPLNNQPFGGVQMIFVGDLYQLPPVVNNMERDIFKTEYDTPYFFSAKALQNTKLEMVELNQVYRQKDQDFVDLLNKIRNNDIDESDLDLLNQRHVGDDVDDTPSDKKGNMVITLTTTNKKADAVNEDRLAALKGIEYCNNAEIKGNFGKEYYPTAVDLTYKIGAQIMLLNNDSKKRWVNGSIGIIEGGGTDEEGKNYLRVRMSDSQKIMHVYPFTWEVFKFAVEDNKIVSEAAGSYTQYPFRLAWAVTIHKSQGKTFDEVTIDMGRGSFAAGQTYVALSRCTSFEGIRLSTPIRKSDIQTDPRIYKFLTQYKYDRANDNQSKDEKIQIIEAAIVDKTDLKIIYLQAKNIEAERIVTPLSLGMEHYNGNDYWALKAVCKNENENRMFNAERILWVEVV